MGRSGARPLAGSFAGLSVSHILDSSALIALIKGERGAEFVLSLIPNGHVSAIIACETATKMFDLGETPKQAWVLVKDFDLSIHPFDTEAARIASGLRPISRPFGLSFADRACLALGIKLGLPVYTADRAWAQLKIGLDIRLIR